LKQIDSKNNPLVKKAMRISAGKSSEDAPSIVVEGIKLIDEAIKSGAKLQMCFIDDADTLKRRAELENKAILVPRIILKELATVQSPGNIVAYFEPGEQEALSANLTKAQIVVVLDRIQDPGNLGTIMRTSEAMGASTIILLKGCCNQFNPKVIRAAMGSGFRMPVFAMPDHKSVIKLLKQHDFTSIATGMTGIPLPNFCFPHKCALFFGQEGQGLNEQIFAECTVTLAIPMQGQVESLNVATSVAICLYEWSKGRTG